MKKIAKYAAFCLALATVFSVAGCSGNNAAPTSSAPASTAAASGAGSNASTPAAPVTITLWGSVPTDSQWKAVYAEWQKEYPNITIDYWRGESSDYEKKLQVAMAGGQGPDVLWLQPSDITKYQSFLDPLDDYASRDFGANWKDQLSSASYLTEITGKSGKVLALPQLASGQQLVLYNKTLFDQVGITSVPTTLDEWVKDANILKAHHIIPVAAGLKDEWACTDLFLTLNGQVAPGSVYNAINGKLSWTDQKMVDTMNAWKKLYDSNILETGSLGIATYPDARDQYFYSTKSAMFLTGSWHLSYALPDGEKFQNGVAISKDTTGAFLLPQIGANPTKPISSIDTSFGINNSSANKEAAWNFVKFMFNGKGEQIMVNTLQGFPVLKNAQVGDETLGKLAPTDKAAYNMAVKAFADPVGIRAIPYSGISDALSAAMQNVATGKQTAEQALQTVQQASDSVQR